MKRQFNQSGRSMVEMLGVLAIIGVLSVGGIAGYSKAMDKYRTQKALDQLTILINNIRSLPNLNGLDSSSFNTELAIRLGIVPTEMLNGKSPTTATKAYNVFNREIDIAMGDFEFGIDYHVGSLYACTTLAAADWGDGLSYISINGIGDSFFREDLPLKASVAAQHCRMQFEGNDNEGYIGIAFKK
ncbi:MAG: type II secretion system protein [Alphaproteobacteria bacterium]|nr:type II secretion system protein [Alphaproteobacteria bacterium]